MSKESMHTGQTGEQIAAAEYERNGYRIIGRNVRLHGVKQIGEIDIVAVRGKELVFVEVKTRRNLSFGFGAESVDYFKQRKLARAAKAYLMQKMARNAPDWRFDVVQVDIDNDRANVIILENVIEDLD